MFVCQFTHAHKHAYIHILGREWTIDAWGHVHFKGVVKFILLTETFFKLIRNKWCSSIIHKILLKFWKHSYHFYDCRLFNRRKKYIVHEMLQKPPWLLNFVNVFISSCLYLFIVNSVCQTVLLFELQSIILSNGGFNYVVSVQIQKMFCIFLKWSGLISLTISVFWHNTKTVSQCFVRNLAV